MRFIFNFQLSTFNSIIMKNIVFVFVMVLMLGSCKDATKNLMPAVTGKINQVLIIAEKNTWDGSRG